MKSVAIIMALGLLLSLTGCRSSQRSARIGCATCIFHMKNVAGCKLAVKLDGKPYLVSGSDIDDHGDAHASDGLCNAERIATVEGKIENGQFSAKRISVLSQNEP